MFVRGDLMKEITTQYIYERAKEIDDKSKFVNNLIDGLKIGMNEIQSQMVDNVMREVMELTYLKCNFTRFLDENKDS